MKSTGKQYGFTIIELMLATLVFSMVLLVVLTSFVQIGRIFYKGVYMSRTNEISRTIVEEISEQLKIEDGTAVTAVQNAGTVSAPMPSGPNVNKQVHYFCISNVRYTYIANHQAGVVPITAANANSNFGLRRDTVPSNSCTNPVTTGYNNPQELLGTNMRIGHRDDITITNTGGGLYSVHFHLNYGDTDLYDQNGNGVTNPGDIGTQPGVLCTGSVAGSQFCATSTIDTAINSFGS